MTAPTAEKGPAVTTVDHDRELIAATARRHLHTLPVRASTALSAAVDELTDPLVLPALIDVAEDPRPVTAVLSDVLPRLATAVDTAPTVTAALARARAVRQLRAALDALHANPA